MRNDPYDNIRFICKLSPERVYDDIYCENKADGGYGHCGECDYLRIQERSNNALIQEFFRDGSPVNQNTVETNPDFLEIM
jgi:hypothetical protein